MRALLLCALPCITSAWTFREFMHGDWDLEGARGGVPLLARYSLDLADGGGLAGKYTEASRDDPSTTLREMVVRVDFDAGAGHQGSFRMGKSGADPAETEPVFDFDFEERNGGAAWLSESTWLGKSGGTIQFSVVGNDAFVLTHVTVDAEGRPKLVHWAAKRSERAAATGSASKPKRSLLQRWGWYLGAAILVCTPPHKSGSKSLACAVPKPGRNTASGRT